MLGEPRESNEYLSSKNKGVRSRKQGPDAKSRLNSAGPNGHLRSNYGGFSYYNENCKNKMFAKEDAMVKTSSCFSSQDPYDYAGDVLEHQSYSLKSNSNENSQVTRPVFRLTSAHNKAKSRITFQEQEKMFKHSSIHQIKAKR
jgi:hypothetical protein